MAPLKHAVTIFNVAYSNLSQKYVLYPLRALAADFQLFSLYLRNKTTFCFPIKKYPTIDSFTFSYIN